MAGTRERSRLQPGQKVLIHAGAGGVGTVAIQLAKHLGAHVATTATASNAAFVRHLGAEWSSTTAARTSRPS